MARVGNACGAARTAGALCHAEQPEFRYHHLRDRFCDDVCRMQEKMAVYIGRGGADRRDPIRPPVAIAMEKAGILHSYQLSRILVWKNPEAYPKSGGYQVLQGLYAIGSGGLLGKGSDRVSRN